MGWYDPNLGRASESLLHWTIGVSTASSHCGGVNRKSASHQLASALLANRREKSKPVCIWNLLSYEFTEQGGRVWRVTYSPYIQVTLVVIEAFQCPRRSNCHFPAFSVSPGHSWFICRVSGTKARALPELILVSKNQPEDPRKRKNSSSVPMISSFW